MEFVFVRIAGNEWKVHSVQEKFTRTCRAECVSADDVSCGSPDFYLLRAGLYTRDRDDRFRIVCKAKRNRGGFVHALMMDIVIDRRGDGGDVTARWFEDPRHEIYRVG